MTLREIEKSDKVCLIPAEIAEVLGADPQTIRAQAWREPERLGFPVIITGSRIRIPRIPFLNFLLKGVAQELEVG